MSIPSADRDLSKAHPILIDHIQKLMGIMDRIGHPVFIVEAWRSPERQAALYALGRTEPGAIVTNAPPGESKHEHTESGRPCAHAIELAFETSGLSPWDESHPWGTLRMAAVELCRLRAISKWDAASGRFYGDRPHFEINV